MNDLYSIILSAPAYHVTLASGGSVPASVAFDGSSYIEFPVSAIESMLYGASAYTVSAWINPTSLPGSEMTFVGLRVGSNAGLDFGIDASAKLMARCRSQSADSSQVATGAMTISAAQWTHVAVVVDIAADNVKLYVNGVQDANLSATFGATVFNPVLADGPARFGANTGSTPIQFYTGALCDVAIYRGAVSLSDLAALAARTSRANQISTDPCAYWPLQDVGANAIPVVGGVIGWAIGTVSRAGSTASLPTITDPVSSDAWNRFGKQVRTLRIRAADASATGVGNPVSSISVLGAGSAATQSGTARPTYQTSGSTSVLRFDGTDDSLVLAGGLSMEHGLSVVCLADVGAGGSGSSGRILSASVVGGGSEVNGFAVTAVNGLLVGGSASLAFSSYSDYTAGTTGMALFSGRWSGKECKNWLNGVARNGTVSNGTELSDGSFVATSLPNALATQIHIGRRNVGSGLFANVDLADAIIVMGNLTDEEVQYIEGVLAWENSRTSLLPVGHPWKSVQPTGSSAISYAFGSSVVVRTAKAASEWVGSPSICRASNGDLYAMCDVFNATTDAVVRAHLSRSVNGGSTWSQIKSFKSTFWPTIWQHTDGLLYCLATDRQYGNLKIMRSSDSGLTWTTTILSNGTLLAAAGAGLTAPNYHRGGGLKPLYHGGYLFFGCEDNTTATWASGFQSFVLYAPASADLMTASNWSVTSKLAIGSVAPYGNRTLPAAQAGFLEGNVVVDDSGQMYNVLRFASNTPDIAAFIPLTWTGSVLSYPAWSSAYLKSMPGGQCKFEILKSGSKFYAVTNDYNAAGVGSPYDQDQRDRQVLVSASSTSLASPSFTQEQVLVNEATIRTYTGKSAVDSVTYHGFQYPSSVIAGSDLHILTRVGWSGADDYHNSNFLGYRKVTI